MTRQGRHDDVICLWRNCKRATHVTAYVTTDLWRLCCYFFPRQRRCFLASEDSRPRYISRALSRTCPPSRTPASGRRRASFLLCASYSLLHSLSSFSFRFPRSTSHIHSPGSPPRVPFRHCGICCVELCTSSVRAPEEPRETSGHRIRLGRHGGLRKRRDGMH